MPSPVIRSGQTVYVSDANTTVAALDANNTVRARSVIVQSGQGTAQEKTVAPSESTQVVVPDYGYDYLSRVTVLAIDVMTSEEITAAVAAGWNGE